MDIHAGNSLELSPPPTGSAGRFAYAGGSRPLEGFTIKRGIGRGGFGEVYYAISDAGKEVALKLIRRNMDIELRGVTQCLNLKHQNLLAIFDIKRDVQDDAWVVMEYVNGESLEGALERHSNGLPLPDVQRWLRGILAAVAYLHDHGIVHRDLKPGNIFTDDGVVKLGDYGLSKFISCSRRSGQTESVGTVHYMAPEIANGRYGKEIDLYALGVIVYEMLTGKVPFEGESIGEVLMKHLTAQPDVRRLPEPYRSAVALALTKDPTQRVPSALEFGRRMGVALPQETGLVSELGPVLHAPGVLTSVPPPPPTAPLLAGQNSSFAQYPVLESNGLHLPPPVAPPQSAFRPPPLPGANEEPILRAVKVAWRQLTTAWTAANFGVPAKIGMILIAFIVLVPMAGIWAVAAAGLGAAYLVYRLVRAFILVNADSSRRQGAAFPPPPPTVASAAAETFERKEQTKEPAAKAYGRTKRWKAETIYAARGPRRERVTELLGSLLLSAGVAGIAAVVVIMLRGVAPTPSQFAWLATVGTFGAWAILIPSKIWEGPVGEQLLRRLVLFVLGLGVGAGAFGVQTYLQMGAESLSYSPGWITNTRYASSSYYDGQGMPGLIANMLYFGFVLMIPKWWSLTEWFRPARLRIWPIAVCVFWAWALHQFWPFPQPWGLFATGVIALAVQLSSPWPNVARERRPES